MKKYLAFLCLLIVSFGCGSNNSGEEIEESWVNEPTDKYYLAMGGVFPGRDELIIYDEDNEPMEFKKDELVCEASTYNGENIVELLPRDGFDSISSGSGALIKTIGIGRVVVTCTKNDMPLGETYGVVVPPQELIQVLVAEAGIQIKDEAVFNDDFVVGLDSLSPTAEALAFVIRNRVNMVRDYLEPEAFMADEELFDSNPPSSNYEAIITAENQFLPVSDPENIYYSAVYRDDLDSRDWRIAYDQAVLSAGSVFVGDISDPTCGDKDSDYDPFCGAFGFKSPTEDEWKALKLAMDNKSKSLPEAGGISEDRFAFFKPIQVLVLDNIWKYDDGRPSFVFIRKRGSSDPAVTNIP